MTFEHCLFKSIIGKNLNIIGQLQGLIILLVINHSICVQFLENLVNLTV